MAPGKRRLIKEINLNDLGAHKYLYNHSRASNSCLGRDSFPERLQVKQSDLVEKLVRLSYLSRVHRLRARYIDTRRKSEPLRGGTNVLQVYAALLVEAIKDIEEDNRSSRAELKHIRGGQGSSPDDDRTECMGWVIDDFPGNAEQV